jgi:hypothetical protein
VGWGFFLRSASHVQAIIVAINQYAEAALDNRKFFLNKSYGVGRMKDDIP